MQDNRLWLLIARKLAGEATDAELEELQRLLADYPDRQYVTDILQTYFNPPGAGNPGQETMDEGMENRFLRIVGDEANREYTSPLVQPSRKTAVYRLRKTIKYAALIVLTAGAGWLGVQLLRTPLFNNTRQQAAQASQVVAKPGVKTRLVLPDGTEVWLNSGSRLLYQDDFNRIFREVELDGEGFFDVVKDAAHPFIVHTDGIDIKVLGTAFNVKSYPTDKTIEATLLRGVIEVTRKNDPNAPKVILKPNEKLTFSKELTGARVKLRSSDGSVASATEAADIAITPILKNIPDSDKEETSWLYNRLVFNGDSFSELAAKMERWYNVTISFKSDRLLQYRFKGAFDKETVQEALNALKLTAKFRYEIHGNEIALYER